MYNRAIGNKRHHAWEEAQAQEALVRDERMIRAIEAVERSASKND